jgi:hypothetical protein
MSLYENQIQDGTEIAHKFMSAYYGILLAQMQSGKTGTYLACAKAMLESGQVNEVLIISGSSDRSLRDQAKSDAKKIFGKTDYSDKVTVMFSQDLNTLLETPDPTIEGNTLIIHDECHLAQSKNNRPNEYYERMGLDGALKGDFSVLRERHIKILAVSATPFSEITSNYKISSDEWKTLEKDPSKTLEEKFVFPLKHGEGYIGIQELMDDDSFKYEAQPITDTSYEHLNKVLCDNREKYDKSFVVIRTRKAEPELLKHLAQRHGYTHKTVFGDSSSPKNLNFMKNQPENATIVQISGRFRMGQVVPKRYIRMVYEQTLKPNADTILQGLPGRMCGYISQGAHTGVDIFVSVHTQEFFKDYSESWTTNEPHKLTDIKKAMNLKPGSQKVGVRMFHNDTKGDKWIATVPIRLNPSDLEDTVASPCPLNDIIKHLTPTDLLAIIDKNQLDNFDLAKIIEILKENEGQGKSYLHRHLEGKGPQRDIPKLSNAFQMNQRCNTTSGKNTPMTLLVKPFSIIAMAKLGEVYLVGWVPYDETNAQHTDIQESTLAEVVPKCNYNPFAYEREDGERIVANGGQTINFPRLTATDPQVFREELLKSVLRSIPESSTYIQGCQRSVTTNYDRSSRKYSGLHFSHEVYDEELIRDILARVQAIVTLEIASNVTIAIHKAKGKQPKGYLKFSSITW